MEAKYGTKVKTKLLNQALFIWSVLWELKEASKHLRQYWQHPQTDI